MNEVILRMQSLIDDLEAKYKGKTFILVSHAGMCNVFLMICIKPGQLVHSLL